MKKRYLGKAFGILAVISCAVLHVDAASYSRGPNLLKNGDFYENDGLDAAVW